MSQNGNTGHAIFMGASENPEQPTKNAYEVAMFRSQEQFPRRFITIRCENVSGIKRGDIVMLETVDGSQLHENTLCFIRKTTVKETNRERIDDVICYTTMKLSVVEKDLPEAEVFVHPEFGRMKDEKSLMKVGDYYSVSFVLVTRSYNRFQFEIRGANLLEREAIRQNNATEAEKLKMMSELVSKEIEFIIETDTQSWNTVQHLKYVATFEDDIFNGDQPIFELLDDQYLDLFRKLTDGAAKVKMILQVENEDGTFTDAVRANHPFGTIQEGVFTEGNRCMVKPTHRDRFFNRNHQVGQIFRFESDMDKKIVDFWKDQKQEDNPLFGETMEVQHANRYALEDIIEQHKLNIINKVEEEMSTAVEKCRDPLNEVQKQAMVMAMTDTRGIVCIQGPPGTGKTQTLASIIIAYLTEKRQVMVLTPTREALKNIHNAVEAKIEKDPAVKKKWQTDLVLMTAAKFNHLINNDPECEVYREEREKLKLDVHYGIISEEKFQEEDKRRSNFYKNQLAEKYLTKVGVAFSTIASSFAMTIGKQRYFNPAVCIVDEAGQVKESDTWPAVAHSTRLVMAGDPQQLPSVVKSNEGRAYQINRSLMDRIMDKKHQFSWIMLQNQYRNHPNISNWSSRNFYENQINNQTNPTDKITGKFSADYMKQATHKDLLVFEPFVLYDTVLINDKTRRIGTYEVGEYLTGDKTQKTDLSYKNIAEAWIVMSHFFRLIGRGVKQETIAIITPYAGQKKCINDLLEHALFSGNVPADIELDMSKVNIDTVDSYQGQEFDVVIFSMVRSNPMWNLGFVSDVRRLNVAITRAKYHFCLVGNGLMLHKNHNKSISDLFETFIRMGTRFNARYGVGQWDINNCHNMKDNFGVWFEDFKAVCRDPKMIEFCEEFKKRGQDRLHQKVMADRRDQRRNYQQRNYGGSDSHHPEPRQQN